MTTYRTGNHWGITIVREADAGPSASGYVCDGCGGQAEVWIDDRPLCRREPEARADAQLVAVVVNGDQALAERICALLNGGGRPYADFCNSLAHYPDCKHAAMPADGDAPSRPLSEPLSDLQPPLVAKVGVVDPNALETAYPPADSCTCVYRPNGGPDPNCVVHHGRRARGPKPPPLGPGCICDGSGRTCPRHGAVI